MLNGTFHCDRPSVLGEWRVGQWSMSASTRICWYVPDLENKSIICCINTLEIRDFNNPVSGRSRKIMQLTMRSDMIGRPNKSLRTPLGILDACRDNDTKFPWRHPFEDSSRTNHSSQTMPVRCLKVREFSTFSTKFSENSSSSLLAWHALRYIVPWPLPDTYHCLH